MDEKYEIPTDAVGRVHVYVRVSTIEQARDDRTSLAEQERRCRAAARLYTSDEPEIWSDAAVSGSTPLGNRPAGGAMIGALRPHDIIIAAKLDRLFRSARDALTQVDDFAACEVDIVLLDASTDPILKSPSGKLFFSLLASFAEFERDRIRDRMVEAKQAKLARGGHIGGSPPFGWRVERAGKDAHLVEDEREQATLKAVYAAWDAGKRPSEIAYELDAAGHRTRRGTQISATQVQRWVMRVTTLRPNETVSERTRRALAAKKAAGAKLGNPNIRAVAPLGVAEVRARAAKFAAEILPVIRRINQSGVVSYVGIADVLNGWRLPAARGGQWHASQVRALMIRLGEPKPRARDHKRAAVVSRRSIAYNMYRSPQWIAQHRRGIERAKREGKYEHAKRNGQEQSKRALIARRRKARPLIPRILALRAEGFTVVAIAHALRVDERSVYRALKVAREKEAKPQKITAVTTVSSASSSGEPACSGPGSRP